LTKLAATNSPRCFANASHKVDKTTAAELVPIKMLAQLVSYGRKKPKELEPEREQNNRLPKTALSTVK
jgi:hypothetical protein